MGLAPFYVIGIRTPCPKKLVSRANILVFGVLIGFFALIGFTIWDRFAAARSSRQWTQHTYDVLGAIRDLEIMVREAETSQRGFLLTGRDNFLTSHDAAIERSSILLAELQRLTADNAAQQARLQALTPAWQRRAQQFARTIEIRKREGT